MLVTSRQLTNKTLINDNDLLSLSIYFSEIVYLILNIMIKGFERKRGIGKLFVKVAR